MNQKKDYVLRWIPKYSIIPLITALVLNTLVYSGTMVLCKGLYHHDFTTAFDRMVPVIPEFTSIYLICYVFWVVNYIMTARISREHMYRFLTADYLSRIVCGIFFVFLPTTLVSLRCRSLSHRQRRGLRFSKFMLIFQFRACILGLGNENSRRQQQVCLSQR